MSSKKIARRPGSPTRISVTKSYHLVLNRWAALVLLTIIVIVAGILFLPSTQPVDRMLRLLSAVLR